MNKWKRARWFTALGANDDLYHVFKCNYIPQWTTHGELYKFAFGPYATRKKAIQVAGYQSSGRNIIINN